MMRVFRKSVLAVLLAAMMVLVMVGCTNTDEGGGNNNQPANTALSGLGAQVEYAQGICNDIYGYSESNGGLFGAGASAASAGITAQALSEPEYTLDGIKDVFAKYTGWGIGNYKTLINSYAADVFTYSQVQLSLMEEFGESTLYGTYALDYSGIDWNNVDLGSDFKEWYVYSLPYAAQFAGADLEAERVYCTQSHSASGRDVLAQLEYYYSDNELGVTTINWHYSGDVLVRFEYHFCDITSGLVLTVSGDVIGGEIVLNRLTFSTLTNDVSHISLSKADCDFVYEYVRQETERISTKTNEMTAANMELAKEAFPDEDFENAETVTHSVNLDFDVLHKMYI